MTLTIFLRDSNSVETTALVWNGKFLKTASATNISSHRDVMEEMNVFNSCGEKSEEKGDSKKVLGSTENIIAAFLSFNCYS